MKVLKIISIILGVLVVLNLVVVGINIMQNGGDYSGESIEEILGKKAEDATVHDILALSKKEFMQLFFASEAPDFNELNGEYKAVNLPSGILAFVVNFYTNYFFGPGSWIGKAFFPLEAARGEGYNIFSYSDSNGETAYARANKVDTHIGVSVFDDKQSFHLNYGPHNGGLNHSMRDELRKINGRLYIGLGYMGAGGGSINPSPFIVYCESEPAKWIGAD